MVKTKLKELVSHLRYERHILRIRFDTVVTRNERISKSYIGKLLPKNPVIVDAGAHNGSDSIEMCRLFGGASIYSFEPVPEIFEALKLNVARHPRILVYNLALSSKTGKQRLYISSGTSDGSSSFLKPKDHLKDHPDVLFDSELQVQAISLDDWAAQENVKNVDFMWLDMQGYELEVLKASKVILPTVKVIHMEVSTRITYEGVPLYEEVKKWMKEQGFEVQVEAIPKGWDMGNVLFVRK